MVNENAATPATAEPKEKPAKIEARPPVSYTHLTLPTKA